MRRAGGYAGYDVAYKRLLLASSRPLEAADANRLAPGRHRVTVDEYEWGWSFIKLTLEGRARRRISVRCRLDSPLWEQLWRALDLDAVPGRLGKLARQVVGRELWVTVTVRGDVDIRVCLDGTYAVSQGEHAVSQFDTLREAEQFLKDGGMKPRRPAVTAFGRA